MSIVRGRRNEDCKEGVYDERVTFRGLDPVESDRELWWIEQYDIFLYEYDSRYII